MPSGIVGAIPPILYDGFEFENEIALGRYKRLRLIFLVTSLLSVATIIPALFMFVISLASSFSYTYLIPLAVGGVFSVFSYWSNSRLTELVNSDEVRHTI